MKIFLCLFAFGVFALSAQGDELTKAAQQKLKAQGLFLGEATGQPSSKTDEAIRRYQLRHGLKVTGRLDDETIRSLGLNLTDASQALPSRTGDGVLTLHECIALCLSQNPKLTSEKYTLAAAKENIWRARSGLLPELNGSATFDTLSGSPAGYWALLGINDLDVTGQNNIKEASRETGHGPYRISWGWVGTGQLRLEYPLYANGSILGLNNAPAVAIAKAIYNKQGWALRLANEDVLANLVATYFNTAAYIQKVELDKQKVELFKQRLAILQEELNLNLVLPQLVDVGKQQLLASQQLLATSETRAADGEKALLQLLGRPIDEKIRIDVSDPRLPPLPQLDSFLSRVSETHPSVEIQRAAIQEANQNYRLAQTALYPQVHFQSSYGGGTAFGPLPLDQFFAGVSVEVPLWDFGHKLSSEHINLDQLKAAQAQLEQVQLSLKDSLLSQISSIHTIEADLAELQTNYLQAKVNVDLIESEHDQGLATQLALVDAKLNLWQLKDQMLLLQLTQRVEYANLQRLAGGVWSWNR